MNGLELKIEILDENTPTSIDDMVSVLVKEEQEEMYPNDPFKLNKLDDQEKEEMNKLPQAVVVTRWYVENNNEIVGFGLYLKNNPDFPHQVFSEKQAFFNIFVTKNRRRNGIGSAMMNHILDIINRDEISSLTTNTLFSFAQRFLEKFDGMKTSETVESRLYIHKINQNNYNNYLAISLPTEYSCDIVLSIDEGDLADYCEVYNYLYNNTTAENSGDSDFLVTPESIKITEEQNALRNAKWYTLLLKNSSGKIIAFTEMNYDDEPYRIRQNLTGVLPEYRGNGFGKLIKAKLLEHILSLYPDIKYVYTGNNITNAPMLYINEKLGFEREYTRHHYKIMLNPQE